MSAQGTNGVFALLVVLKPFTIDEAPHIYFSGNASSFETRLVRRADNQVTRLLMVPTFSKTGTAVLVDVNSPEFDVQPLEFGVQ